MLARAQQDSVRQELIIHFLRDYLLMKETWLVRQAS